MAHAEDAVNVRDIARGSLFGDGIEVAIFRVDDCSHIAERQHCILRFVAQHLIHGARPVNATACHVPIPQAAATAPQRQIDTALDLAGKVVGLASSRRLPEIGVKDGEHHAGRACEERHIERHCPAPFRKDRAFRFDGDNGIGQGHRLGQGAKSRFTLQHDFQHACTFCKQE